MQEKEIVHLAHIKVSRSQKGLLKRIPTRLLIDNRYVAFYPSETKEFHTAAGELTIVINKRRALTFDADEMYFW